MEKTRKERYAMYPWWLQKFTDSEIKAYGKNVNDITLLDSIYIKKNSK